MALQQQSDKLQVDPQCNIRTLRARNLKHRWDQTITLDNHLLEMDSVLITKVMGLKYFGWFIYVKKIIVPLEKSPSSMDSYGVSVKPNVV